jgi:hypothetical protein
MSDKRYTVRKEFCGASRMLYVARFCGEWLGSHAKRGEASKLCERHHSAAMILARRDSPWPRRFGRPPLLTLAA